MLVTNKTDGINAENGTVVDNRMSVVSDSHQPNIGARGNQTEKLNILLLDANLSRLLFSGILSGSMV